MGFLSDLFKKRQPPEPYDWAFLREMCLQAIESRAAPPELATSLLGGLDYERLTASGEDSEDVIVEIWAVLRDAKVPELTVAQSQEYLRQAGEMLRAAPTPEAAASQLKEIEEKVRKN